MLHGDDNYHDGYYTYTTRNNVFPRLTLVFSTKEHINRQNYLDI